MQRCGRNRVLSYVVDQCKRKFLMQMTSFKTKNPASCADIIETEFFCILENDTLFLIHAIHFALKTRFYETSFCCDLLCVFFLPGSTAYVHRASASPCH